MQFHRGLEYDTGRHFRLAVHAITVRLFPVDAAQDDGPVDVLLDVVFP
jgi:hypothetical protein